MKTSFLYYPEGVDLSLHELTIVNGLVTFPFQLLIAKPHGVVLGYNVALIFSFVLAGIGAHLLFYYLTRNVFASFVGGLAFAFAPYRTVSYNSFGSAEQRRDELTPIVWTLLAPK